MPTQLVLRVLLEDPERERYGLEICSASDLPSGTIHPILARLEGYGWVESWWEETDPRQEGRPRRRYYRLTADGAERSRIALAAARSPVGRMALPSPLLRPGPAGGHG
ncbi:PadR family transcriptional regulator [Nonomuraea sp. NPDC050022]|uniref:PadR family transcriptional regulator n=1 Tax=Nonomuraea sp. NPDC050022 TaxID=3364358 RepID=UPI0037A3FC77